MTKLDGQWSVIRHFGDEKSQAELAYTCILGKKPFGRVSINAQTDFSIRRQNMSKTSNILGQDVSVYVLLLDSITKTLHALWTLLYNMSGKTKRGRTRGCRIANNYVGLFKGIIIMIIIIMIIIIMIIIIMIIIMIIIIIIIVVVVVVVVVVIVVVVVVVVVVVIIIIIIIIIIITT